MLGEKAGFLGVLDEKIFHSDIPFQVVLAFLLFLY